MFFTCITCLENAQKIFYGTKMKSHAPLKKAFFDTPKWILALVECHFSKIDKIHFLLTWISLYVSCGPKNYMKRFIGPQAMFFTCITCLENAQKVFYGTKMKSHAPLKKAFFDTPNWILALVEYHFSKIDKTHFLLTWINLYVSCGPTNYTKRFLGP